MWLATQHGFYSIVQKDADLYFVRARIRQDLENLLEILDFDAEILVWPTADYRYRIQVDFEGFLEIMVQLAGQLDYPNFKGRIYECEDQSSKLGPYHRIWELMADMQASEKC